MDVTLKERLGKDYDEYIEASNGTFFGINIDTFSKEDLRCVIGYLRKYGDSLFIQNQRERETWKAIYPSRC